MQRARRPADHGRAQRDLGVHHDETTADGSITLEHAECLAACDYAPVVTVDYEFYDQQDVESARELVAALRRGEKPLPTRGAPLTDFKGISRQLAGFSQYDDAARDGAPPSTRRPPSARRWSGCGWPRSAASRRRRCRGGPPRAGRRAARRHRRAAGHRADPGDEAADAARRRRRQPGRARRRRAAHPDAPEPAGRRLPDGREGTDTPRQPGTGRPRRTVRPGPSRGKA